MKIRLVLALMLALSIPHGIALATPILVDSFNTTPAWSTYNRDPSSFGSVSYLGDNRLGVGVTKTDYNPQGNNVQGKQVSFPAVDGWSATIDLFNSSFSNMAANRNNPDATSLLRGRTDFWAITDTGQFGFALRFLDDNDPFGGRFIAPFLERYDPVTKSWVSFQSFGIVSNDFWMKLAISSTPSGYGLYLNDNLMYVGSFAAGSLTGVAVGIENYNSNYTGHFDNLNVSGTPKTSAVPDAGSTGVMAALALIALVGFHRFIPKFQTA